ncbi:CatA-like O-acetyltransferase [Algibacter sp. L4_22]|uniref:CatA-like O-acetyltransferase n=1 Tax=Algibacter sp. L4_22 TaxID=2942477 RepID=UPI00201B8B39|nr:CatA-like O-acetyltransferase [Algibacter sp. L4_22]MCL5128055.1 CatA-like O-acetyltransferase [Algibacter sp. L4_22]
MKVIDINTWSRKQHFEHFSALTDPSFAVTIPFNVTNAYQASKATHTSFFTRYLHDCMRAINEIENFRYRIEDDKIVEYDVIHASPTILREDNTFGFSFVNYNEDLVKFSNNLETEKTRIKNSKELFPPVNGLDCIHCSAMPWVNFIGHKEPSSGLVDSVPKLSFGKATSINNELIMNVSIHVNHALVDGYHVGLFSKKFQHFLNQ